METVSKDDATPGPLFVVGMNGSGTTMMLNHLGQHPDLYAFPGETSVLPYYLQNQSKYGDLQNDSNFRRLWDDLRSSYPFRLRNARKPIDLPEDWLEIPRSAAGIFDRIIRIFASKEGKTRWSEKTPFHVLHILMIAQAFPDSRFIHMVRDGRDCAISDHRRWGRHPNGTIYRWKNVIAEGRRQGELIGDRYVEMRYEDVTRNPEHHMRLACAAAGIRFDERVLRTERPRQHVTGNDSKTIVRDSQRNKAYFGRRRLVSLEQIAGKCLTDIGYTTTFCKGDRNPSLAVRSWWTVHDAWRVSCRHIREKYTVQKNLTWSLLFARWKMILRSKIVNSRRNDSA